MVPTSGKDSEGGHEKKSLRSPILLPEINIAAALSTYEFCGFDGRTLDVSDRQVVTMTAEHENLSVNGEVAGTSAGVVASSAKENALIVLAALCVMSSASVLRGVFDNISSRR